MNDKNRVDVMVGDILRAETLPNDWVVLYHSDDGGVAIRDIVTGEPGGAFFSDAWEVIRRADGSDPRTEKVGRETRHATDGQRNRTEVLNLDAVGAALRLLHKPLPRQPHELYAEFHRVVTETVKREAPRVSVVTDFSATHLLAWLVCGGRKTGFVSPPMNPGVTPDYVYDVRMCIHTLRADLGTDALK